MLAAAVRRRVDTILAPRRRTAATTLRALPLALVLGSATVLFVEGLTDTAADYDEGVYLASADALRHGQELGSSVFASQLPAFYNLLVAATALFGTTLHGVRVAVLLLALASCAAGYITAARAAGPVAGSLAGLGIAAAPFFGLYAHRIAADLPSVAFVLVAFACLAFRGPVPAAAGGVAFGLALTIKISALAALVTLLVLALQRRVSAKEGIAATAGAAAVLAAVLLVHRHGLGEIWQGAVVYHDRARDVPFEGHNEYRLRHEVLGLGVPFGWFLGLGILGTLLSDSARRIALPYWGYAFVAGAFLLWHRPLHDNHFVVLAPAAVPAAIGAVAGARVLPVAVRWVVPAGAALALVLAFGASWRDSRDARGPEPAEIVRAAALVRSQTRPGELVVSDRQYVAVRAGRRVPGDLVDTAVLRFETKMLSSERVERTLARDRIRVVFAGRAFLLQPRLMMYLRAHFRTRYHLGAATLFVRGRP